MSFQDRNEVLKLLVSGQRLIRRKILCLLWMHNMYKECVTPSMKGTSTPQSRYTFKCLKNVYISHKGVCIHTLLACLCSVGHMLNTSPQSQHNFWWWHDYSSVIYFWILALAFICHHSLLLSLSLSSICCLAISTVLLTFSTVVHSLCACDLTTLWLDTLHALSFCKFRAVIGEWSGLKFRIQNANLLPIKIWIYITCAPAFVQPSHLACCTTWRHDCLFNPTNSWVTLNDSPQPLSLAMSKRACTHNLVGEEPRVKIYNLFNGTAYCMFGVPTMLPKFQLNNDESRAYLCAQ